MNTSGAKDNFFANEEGLIDVFEFDYELSTTFHQDLFRTIATVLVYPGWCCLLPSYFMCQKANIHDQIYAQHLCVTKDGIKYVIDKHDAGCRFECNQQGKTSKTVPFDKITDCDVQEPAGSAFCCFVPNVLSRVTVDTASSGTKNENGLIQHELNLAGLKDPHGFKKLVWAMKRGDHPDTVVKSTTMNNQSLSLSNMTMERDGGNNAVNARTVDLLSSIDRRMAEQNDLLRQIANK